MKKLLVLVLLVPILALTMISCDESMRSNIAGFMGGFGGNVYSDAGLIVVNTAQADAAAAAVGGIGLGSGVEDADDEGFGVTIPTPDSGTKVLVPQTPAKQKELKDNLGDAFNSTDQTEQLLADLGKPATDDQKEAAIGTIAVYNATLEALKVQLADGGTDLGDTLNNLQLPDVGDGSGLTQGDMLALQLMTDLISNTIATLTEIGGVDGLGGVDEDALNDDDNKDRILSIVDDALFAAEMAEQISGAASINFTGQIDLGSLMDGLDDKGTRSRGDDFELTDAEDFISTINDLAPSIVELMGVTYDGTNFVYTASKYKSFLLNQQIYRSAMDQALKMMELGNLGKDDVDSLAFDTSTLVKYALSVFIIDHEAFYQEKKESDTLDPNLVVAEYLNANKKLGLGTLTITDVLTAPDKDVTGLDYSEWPNFLKTGTIAEPRNLAYYEAFINNLIAINNVGGIAQVTTELVKFRDAAPAEDGLAKWYDEL